MNILTEIAIVGVIGMILQMLMKAKSIQDKARLSNVQFKFWSYFVDDWLSHLISLGAIALYVFLARRRVLDAPVNMYELILALSATVGYAGADIVSRFFSFTNKRINAAIDHKTTIADNSVGVDPNMPTPATKPVNAAHSFSEGSDMK
jgi:hypothetical protein